MNVEQYFNSLSNEKSEILIKIGLSNKAILNKKIAALKILIKRLPLNKTELRKICLKILNEIKLVPDMWIKFRKTCQELELDYHLQNHELLWNTAIIALGETFENEDQEIFDIISKTETSKNGRKLASDILGKISLTKQ
jgi:hypothetical protein